MIVVLLQNTIPGAGEFFKRDPVAFVRVLAKWEAEKRNFKGEKAIHIDLPSKLIRQWEKELRSQVTYIQSDIRICTIKCKGVVLHTPLHQVHNSPYLGFIP